MQFAVAPTPFAVIPMPFVVSPSNHAFHAEAGQPWPL